MIPPNSKHTPPPKSNTLPGGLLEPLIDEIVSNKGVAVGVIIIKVLVAFVNAFTSGIFVGLVGVTTIVCIIVGVGVNVTVGVKLPGYP